MDRKHKSRKKKHDAEDYEDNDDLKPPMEEGYLDDGPDEMPPELDFSRPEVVAAYEEYLKQNPHLENRDGLVTRISKNRKVPAKYHPDKMMHWLIEEGMDDPLFRTQWNRADDTSFCPLAVAVLSLSRAQDMDEGQRRRLFRRICTEKRSKLLSALTGISVTSGLAKLLGKTRWKVFRATDWFTLIRICADPSFLRVLAHMTQIAPTMVRQFDLVPPLIRLPRVLEVLNNLRVSKDHWTKLSLENAGASSNRLSAISASAHQIADIGSFWDFYFECADNPRQPLNLPEASFSSALLHPLSTHEDMVTEGRRMQNCLGHLLGKAKTGQSIFFKMRSGELITSELIHSCSGWTPGPIRGWDNQPVEGNASTKITNELQAIAAQLNAIGWTGKGGEEGGIYPTLCRMARKRFSAAEISRIETAIREIYGRSLNWEDGAYVILLIKSDRFIQFMSDPDGSGFLCEIVSHKYQPRMQRLLTAKAVSSLQAAGVQWPTGLQNFSRWFPVRALDDMRQIAEFSLAILSLIFRHSPGDAIKVKQHIPAETPKRNLVYHHPG